MRKAALVGNLHFSRDVEILDSLILSLKKLRKNKNPDDVNRVQDIFTAASEWSSNSRLSKLPKVPQSLATSTSVSSIKGGLGSFEENVEGPVERIVDGGGILNLCRNITTALTHSMNPSELPPGMCPKAAGNAEWYWPFILMKYKFLLL